MAKKKYDPTRMPSGDEPMATPRVKKDVLHTWRNKDAPRARKLARIAPAPSKRRAGGPSSDERWRRREGTADLGPAMQPSARLRWSTPDVLPPTPPTQERRDSPATPRTERVDIPRAGIFLGGGAVTAALGVNLNMDYPEGLQFLPGEPLPTTAMALVSAVFAVGAHVTTKNRTVRDVAATFAVGQVLASLVTRSKQKGFLAR